MLISSKEAIVLLDDKPIINGFRLNLDPKSHQLRLKTSIYDYDGDNEVLMPIDIVVTNYSNIMFNLPTASFNVTGRELNRNIDFNIKLSVNLVKRSLTGIIGKIGKTNVEFHINNNGNALLSSENLRLLIDQLKEIIKQNQN